MLAILSTHPIQYQTPIWRGLATKAEVPFKVFFMSDQGIKASFDPGFNRHLAWDIDLLDGYPHEFLSVVTGAKQDGFGWLKLKPGFGAMLKAQGVKVLWVQGWQVMAYWQAIREAKKAGIKVWLRGESNLRSNKGGLKQSLKWLVLKRLLNKVDYFLTIGKANEAFYRRLGYRQNQFISAPYCIENKRFRDQADKLLPERASLRAQWGIPEDAFCFLSVGKFIPKKRPLDIVAALAKLQQQFPQKKMHMLWVGTGELSDELHAACDIRYEDGKVFPENRQSRKPVASFAGFLNQSGISRAYVAADALVLPSDAKETWGLVTNEAMASGLPCVVSAEVGCADDLILPNFPEFCYPMGDIEGLVASMARMVEKTPDTKQVREIIEAYDFERTVENVNAVYRRQFSHDSKTGI
ncbi:MAG: glycosyltransferase family 4 protein [Arenimonas sp.]